jgi:hypothetical protein
MIDLEYMLSRSYSPVLAAKNLYQGSRMCIQYIRKNTLSNNTKGNHTDKAPTMSLSLVVDLTSLYDRVPYAEIRQGFHFFFPRHRELWLRNDQWSIQSPRRGLKMVPFQPQKNGFPRPTMQGFNHLKTKPGGGNGMVCNRTVGKRKRCTVIKVREIRKGLYAKSCNKLLSVYATKYSRISLRKISHIRLCTHFP